MLLFFKEKTRAIRSQSLFCHVQPERIAQVTLLLRATRTICSQLLFFKERRKQIDHSRLIIWAILSERAKRERAKSKRAISQPCLKGTRAWLISYSWGKRGRGSQIISNFHIINLHRLRRDIMGHMEILIYEYFKFFYISNHVFPNICHVFFHYCVIL